MEHRATRSIDDLLEQVAKLLRFERATFKAVVGKGDTAKVVTLGTYGLTEHDSKIEKERILPLGETVFANLYAALPNQPIHVVLNPDYQERVCSDTSPATTLDGIETTVGEVYQQLFAAFHERCENSAMWYAIERLGISPFLDEDKTMPNPDYEAWRAKVQEENMSPLKYWKQHKNSGMIDRKKFPTYAHFRDSKDPNRPRFFMSEKRATHTVAFSFQPVEGITLIIDFDSTYSVDKEEIPIEQEILDKALVALQRNQKPFELLTAMVLSEEQYGITIDEEDRQSGQAALFAKLVEDGTILHEYTAAPSRNRIFTTEQEEERIGDYRGSLIVKQLDQPRRVQAYERTQRRLRDHNSRWPTLPKIATPRISVAAGNYLVEELIQGATLYDVLDDLRNTQGQHIRYAAAIRDAIFGKVAYDIAYFQAHPSEELEELREEGKHKTKLKESLEWCIDHFYDDEEEKAKLKREIAPAVEEIGTQLEELSNTHYCDSFPRNLRIDYSGVLDIIREKPASQIPGRILDMCQNACPDLSLPEIRQVHDFIFESIQEGIVTLDEVANAFWNHKSYVTYEHDFEDSFRMTHPRDNMVLATDTVVANLDYGQKENQGYMQLTLEAAFKSNLSEDQMRGVIEIAKKVQQGTIDHEEIKNHIPDEMKANWELQRAQYTDKKEAFDAYRSLRLFPIFYDHYIGKPKKEHSEEEKMTQMEDLVAYPINVLYHMHRLTNTTELPASQREAMRQASGITEVLNSERNLDEYMRDFTKDQGIRSNVHRVIDIYRDYAKKRAS